MVSRFYCDGKACPGGIGTPGTRFFKTFGPFTNTAGVPACITVTINADTGVPNTGDIESAAYLGTYDPTNLCLNYLGDSGVSGLGGPGPGPVLGTASYSFTVPAGASFVVVVNTTGTTNSSQSAAPSPASSTIPRDLAPVRHISR